MASSREFVTEFIELYHSLPCLWLVKSKEYTDRKKKERAYAELVKKYKEIDPAADKYMVVKKISSLRTVYKKEVTKMQNSVLSGAGEDEIYKPRLWYFDLLHLLTLQDSEVPAEILKSEALSSESPPCDEYVPFEPKYSHQSPTPPAEEEEEPPTSPYMSRTSSPSPSPSPNLQRKRTAKEEVLQRAEQRLKAIRTDDEHDTFGKYVASMLRSLKGNQEIFARRLINDVIFQREFSLEILKYNRFEAL